ncbi:class I SAM-dependent methyltransferase [Aliterella atlantica]|uniref:Methyltransferase type 11 domain-containing protein n=2 Tax=Aliterella TaxID=1827277 RepID=A0A0D9A0Y4_9CYAN|nr:methyltransferase domain-containing protein [Aliterella atlantica]KJH73151.1 hypothetical protein UH38_03620 [Aliterella atlantica CENA595]
MKKILLNILSRNSLYSLSIDWHFICLRLQNYLFLKTPKKIKTKASFLNIGCGAQGLDSAEWFNLDGWPAEGVDYECDLRRNLPFDEHRFWGIFSEHFFEHLDPADGRKFLEECFRILRPGGIIRLSVPDGELYLKNYLENREWMLELIKYRGWMLEPGKKYHTPMELVNDVFRQNLQHQYCYDFETISLLLSEVGFKNISRVGFSIGSCKQLQIDREERQMDSLYVEATKH